MQSPKTSSVSIVEVPGGDGARAVLVRSVYMGEPLDELNQVGDTHPSATALLTSGAAQYLYVTKGNSDRVGIICLMKGSGSKAGQIVAEVKKDLDLSPVKVRGVKPRVRGAYPNAIVVSRDGSRAYVAEACLNSVAVLDTSEPEKPLLLGLPPNNLGDLFATDLRDMFQPVYNGVTADMLPFTRSFTYAASEEGLKIWSLVDGLDLSGPDRDSRRLGTLARLSMLADTLHAEAVGQNALQERNYLDQQAQLYEMALAIAGRPSSER